MPRLLVSVRCLLLVSLSLPNLVADESKTATHEERPTLRFPAGRADFSRRFEAQWNSFTSASEAERKETDPLQVLGPQFLEFSKGSDEISFFAATFLLRWGHGEPGTPHNKYLVAGFESVLQHHKDNPHLTADLGADIGNGGLPEIETEGFYRKLLKTTKNRAVHAATAYALASHLDNLATIKPRIAGMLDRFSAAGLPVAQLEQLREHLRHREPEQLWKESSDLLEEVVSDYADERASTRDPRGWFVLPTQYLLEPEGDTLGERAERLLFAVSHLREGCEAPDIVGRDSTGKQFRLSDYRGNVVLLMFSFKGCAACEAMYPTNRMLLERFADKPFVVLGVMASFSQDETVQTLRQAQDEGKITWRCWWDGQERKIATRWDVTGWPSPYLIDSRGIVQRYPASGKSGLASAIAKLVKDAPESE